jgi:hypothetical protein
MGATFKRFEKSVKLEALKPWPKNPRRNDKAAEKLAAVLKKVGYVDPVIVLDNDLPGLPAGTIAAGHTRFKAAALAGMDAVPVCYYEFESPEQFTAYALADNKANEWAEWDFSALDNLTVDLTDAGFDVGDIGFDDCALSDSLNDSMFSNDDSDLFQVIVYTPINNKDSLLTNLEKLKDTIQGLYFVAKK